MQDIKRIKENVTIREFKNPDKIHFQARLVRTDKLLLLLKKNTYVINGKTVIDFDKIQDLIKKIESKTWG